MTFDLKLPSKRNVGPLVLAVVCSVALLGCGGSSGGGPKGMPRAEAKGTVTFDGSPVPSGVVSFKHVESNWVVACPIKDGEYAHEKGEGPLTGKNVVSVSGSSPDGRLLWSGNWSKDMEVTSSGVTDSFEIRKDDVLPPPKDSFYSDDPGDQ